MGIAVNLMAAIYRQAYEVWLSITNGTWQAGSTWQKGFAPDASTAQSILITNGYEVKDDNTRTNKNSKIITVDNGIFNPLSSSYAYGDTIVTAAGMLTATYMVLKNNGLIKFPYTNSDLGGEILVQGAGRVAFMGSFSGQGFDPA